MAILLFFVSLAIIVYVYLGYPLIAAAMAAFWNRKVRKAPLTPKVTVLIAAYNEEKVIAATIRNKLAQDYPPDRIDVVIVSDGSTDATDDIVRSFKDPRVRLVRQEPRAGKTSALNLAVPEASGEIIVFSDANSIYAPDAVRKLVSNFADEDVGYVTGKMIYINPDGSTIGDGCSAYMKYENVLRKIETRIGSVVGVDGGIDAVRKVLYQPMQADQLPDFILPLKVIEQGRRVVYEPEAFLMEQALSQPEDEYRMRVRVTLRALWALWDMRGLLSIRRYGGFAWQLWSHKMLRYGCIIPIVIFYISNYWLLRSGTFYAIIFLAQNLFYLSAVFSPLLERKGYKLRILYVAQYFVLLNVACLHALVKFLRGQKQVMWTPRKG